MFPECCVHTLLGLLIPWGSLRLYMVTLGQGQASSWWGNSMGTISASLALCAVKLQCLSCREPVMYIKPSRDFTIMNLYDFMKWYHVFGPNAQVQTQFYKQFCNSLDIKIWFELIWDWLISYSVYQDNFAHVLIALSPGSVFLQIWWLDFSLKFPYETSMKSS